MGPRLIAPKTIKRKRKNHAIKIKTLRKLTGEKERSKTISQKLSQKSKGKSVDLTRVNLKTKLNSNQRISKGNLW